MKREIAAQTAELILRAVRLGPESNGFYPVLEGLTAGERIVGTGSFSATRAMDEDARKLNDWSASVLACYRLATRQVRVPLQSLLFRAAF